MFELIEFKLLLKKYKNIFSDILDNMTIKEFDGNIIVFTDAYGNKMVAQSNERDIVFKMDDKRHVIVNLPEKDDNNDIKVIDVIKEKRSNGCIIEEIEKHYNYTISSYDERVLVDLISKRYAFDKNIPIEDNINLDELSKMKTVFESHMKTLTKSYGSLRWYTDSPYSTITMINGEDISYIYDVVNGDDKIYRIYDLYNGKINERNSNDIFSIHLGLLRKDGLGYNERNGIKLKEDEICGKSNNIITNQDAQLIYNLICNRIGYKKPFDLYDINSIIAAITYQKTAVELAKESIEEELDIPWDEFDKLDYDEQHKLIQNHKKNNKIKKKKRFLS